MTREELLGRREAFKRAIAAELHEAGYDVASIDELRESGVRYRDAVPILLSWLRRVDDDPTYQEFVVRALTVPWARKVATEPMLRLFREGSQQTPAEQGRAWAVGNALKVLATDSDFPEMARLAAEPTYGRARQMVVLWLGATKKHKSEAVDILIDLLDDPDVNGHATEALAKLKAPHSRDALAAMTDDDRAWVRKTAKRAVARLDTGGTP